MKLKEKIRVPSDFLVALILLVWVFILAYRLTAGKGLPSFNKGYFHTSTLAYYVSWAKELHEYGVYTPAWCGGYDLLRYYPPLGLLTLYFFGIVSGDFMYGGYLALFFSIYLFVIATYILAKNITGSSKIGLLLALASPLISGYVSTIAVYWEYTRLMGEALAFTALASLIRFLENGNKLHAKLFAVFGALTLLTHLIAALELTVFATVTLVSKILFHKRRGANLTALSYLITLMFKSLILWFALTAWWLIPALLPYGVSHYLRVTTPFSDKIRILSHTISLTPNIGVASFQLPILLIGILSIVIYLILLKGEEKLPLYYAFALLVLVLAYGQGTRLIPSLGLIFILSFADSTRKLASRVDDKEAKKVSAATVLIISIFTAAYAPFYIQEYWKSFETDNSYLYSDEYTISNFLEHNMEEGQRAYIMYGENLHGNQWVNVFKPRVWQVLSCFMEGCVNRDYIVYDYLLKSSLDYSRIYEASKEMCIKYIVVDEGWFSRNPRNAVKLLVDKGLALREPFSSKLKYSIIFEIRDTGFCHVNKVRLKQDSLLLLLLPSRLIGYVLSLTFLVLYSRFNEKSKRI